MSVSTLSKDEIKSHSLTVSQLERVKMDDAKTEQSSATLYNMLAVNSHLHFNPHSIW